MIVMYDAIGVRQGAGKQGRVLNRLLFEDFSSWTAWCYRKN